MSARSATPERVIAFSDGVFAVLITVLVLALRIRYASAVTPRLLWLSFGHLFAASLLPLSTEWMAVSRLSPQPVSFYPGVFFLVNATYMLLIWELVEPGARTPTVHQHWIGNHRRHDPCMRSPPTRYGPPTTAEDAIEDRFPWLMRCCPNH